MIDLYKHSVNVHNYEHKYPDEDLNEIDINLLTDDFDCVYNEDEEHPDVDDNCDIEFE